MKISYKGVSPEIASDVFVADNASVIGDVRIDTGCSVWFGAAIRGDEASITIGEGTNIQDNVTVHCDTGVPVRIGSHVTIGHNAVVHSCFIGDNVLIGMGAILMSGSVIREGSIVAAGAVVKQETEVPSRTMVAGIPAMAKRNLTDHDVSDNLAKAMHYIRVASEYRLSADL